MFWPRLESLDLSYATLDAAAVVALARSRWLRLSSVSLNCSILNVTGFAQLSQRLWPGLRQLHLRGSPSAVARATLAAFVAVTHIKRCNLVDLDNDNAVVFVKSITCTVCVGALHDR